MVIIFWIWIPNFGLIAKPLHEAFTVKDQVPLTWTGDCQKAFQNIKVFNGPCLHL